MPQLALPALTMLFDKLDEFMLEFEEHDKEIKAGVASVGDAAAYALVWELGNARQTKEGPRTTRGYNIQTGEVVWLTIQRPYGYIRINENLYWEALKDEMKKVKFSGTNAREITEELEACAVKVAKRIVKIISQTAPVAEGKLRDSFEVVEPDDNLLEEKDEFNRVMNVG